MFRAAIFASAIVLSASGALSQESPDAGKLTELLKAGLPPYWSVDNFEVVATSDVGNAVAPQRVFRFEAKTSPSANLFAKSASEGPYDLVVPTIQAEASRTLYGYLDLSYKAGVWSGPTTIENPVTGLGQPLDLFPRPTLVLGAKDTEAKLNDLRSTNVGAAVASIEQEIARLNSEHKANLSKLTQENSSAVAEARAEAEQRLATIQLEYRTKLASLKQENDPLVAEAKADQEKLIAAEKEKTAEALAALREEAAKELEALKEMHAEKRGELIEQQRQEMAVVETRLATELASLQKQLDTSQEIIALQQELRASLEKRNIGSQELFVAFEQAIEQRTQFLSRMPREWLGTLSCTVAGDQATGQEGFTLSTPLVFKVEKVVSNGAEMGFAFSHSFAVVRSPAVLNWSDQGMSFPLRFQMVGQNLVSLHGWEFQLISKLEVSQEGKILGDFKTTISDGYRRQHPAHCAFELSS